MKMILGREPAVFWAMIAAVLQALSLFLPLSESQQGLVNAVLVAAAGFATSAMVSADKALPALAGLISAVFALLLGFGLAVPDNIQVAVMALVGAVGAFFVRQNVVAPVRAVAQRLNTGGPIAAGGTYVLQPDGTWRTT